MSRAAVRFKRGQVWWLYNDAADENDSTQRKSRPWLIVSNDDNNLFAPIINCVPITTRSEKRIPVHVHYKNGDRDQMLLCEQVTTRDVKDFNNPRSYYMYSLSDDLIEEVNDALMMQLGIIPVPRPKPVLREPELTPVRERYSKWTDEQRLMLYEDSDILTTEQIMLKYSIDSEMTVPGVKHKNRLYLKEKGLIE